MIILKNKGYSKEIILIIMISLMIILEEKSIAEK